MSLDFNEGLQATIAKREIAATNKLLREGEALCIQANTPKKRADAARLFAKLYQLGQSRIRTANADILRGQASQLIYRKLTAKN